MKRFAELLLNLILTSSRNDKIDHIVNWIKDSNTEEIGWGLSIICEELEISKVKPSMVKEISKLHIDKYLFDLSYDYVGDMAETVSLIWPEKNDKNANFSNLCSQCKVQLNICTSKLFSSVKNASFFGISKVRLFFKMKSFLMKCCLH